MAERGAYVRRRAEGGAYVRRRAERGQASVELLAGVPALVLAGLLALQLLVAGYSLTLADGAVEAGALAVAADRPPAPAVRAALPGWARDRVDVAVEGGRVTVRLRPPSPVAAIGDALAIRSTAWARPPGAPSVGVPSPAAAGSATVGPQASYMTGSAAGAGRT